MAWRECSECSVNQLEEESYIASTGANAIIATYRGRSELIGHFRVPFASASKRVLVQTLSNENKCYSHINFHANQTPFHFNGFTPGSVVKQRQKWPIWLHGEELYTKTREKKCAGKHSCSSSFRAESKVFEEALIWSGRSRYGAFLRTFSFSKSWKMWLLFTMARWIAAFLYPLSYLISRCCHFDVDWDVSTDYCWSSSSSLPEKNQQWAVETSPSHQRYYIVQKAIKKTYHQNSVLTRNRQRTPAFRIRSQSSFKTGLV